MKPFVAFFALAAASFSGVVSPVHAQKPAPATAPANAAPIFCVITGETIASAKDAAGKTTVAGKTYYFCCPGCLGKFSKASDVQKAKYAKANDLRVKQAVLQKQRDAVKAERKQQEKAAPIQIPPSASAAVMKSGLTCAVTGEAVAAEDAAGGSSQYNGKTYSFCCGRCKAQFDAEPAKYAEAANKPAKGAEVK